MQRNKSEVWLQDKGKKWVRVPRLHSVHQDHLNKFQRRRDGASRVTKAFQQRKWTNDPARSSVLVKSLQGSLEKSCAVFVPYQVMTVTQLLWLCFQVGRGYFQSTQMATMRVHQESEQNLSGVLLCWVANGSRCHTFVTFEFVKLNYLTFPPCKFYWFGNVST